MAKRKKTSTECVTGNRGNKGETSKSKGTSKNKGTSPTSPKLAQNKPERRGRPKGSKNKSKKVSTECVTGNVSGKRGNIRLEAKDAKIPVINNLPTECVDMLSESKGVMIEEQKKGRGRPRKKKKYEVVEIETGNLRTLCLIGYCTECHGMITTGDMAEGKTTIYKCMRCGKREKVTNLTEYKKPSKKPRSKKAFLKDISGTHKELEIEKAYVPDEFQDIIENVNTAETWD